MNALSRGSIFTLCDLPAGSRSRRRYRTVDWSTVAVAALNWAALVVAAFALVAAGSALLFG